MMSDEKQIRFGIIGCAEIARKITRAIKLSPNATLHAIASRSIEKAKQFASKNGLLLEETTTVKIYGSYEELIDDPEVEAVYMPLPTSLHLKWAVLAAKKKKHLLLEKPTAIDVSQLDEILKACESSGVQFMDATMWYHHPRTLKMKEMLLDPQLFGQVKSITSSSSFRPPPEFFENDIRVKPDLDALGALGDTGWYCIGAILWAMNHKLPTTVTALPATERNASGVILTCAASLHWEDEDTVATFYSSFLAHETMELAVCSANGTLHVSDFIIPFQERSASLSFTSGAMFTDLHIGWNMKPQEVEVATRLPQEARMVDEFARLIKSIGNGGNKPESKWPETSRMTQLVLDAVNQSIHLGCKPIQMQPLMVSSAGVSIVI